MNAYIGESGHVSDGRSPGKSNFSKTLTGIGTSGVNRVPKNTGPENVLADLVIGRSAPKNSDTFRSAFLTFCVSVFTWSNVSY